MKTTAPREYSPVRRLGAVTTAIARAEIGVITTKPSATTPALPFAAWPAWAKDLSQARQPADIGLGDTVVHVIGDAHSEAFKKFFRDKLGLSCGCTARQAWLNARFPYV